MITPLDRWISRKIGNSAASLTREMIDAYQLSKLRETVSWVRKKSAFYRENLDGLKEDDLTSLEDLGRFPFTTHRELRDKPLRFLCASQGEISRVVTLETSGTSGSPKRVYFTESDQELTVDFFRHGMSTLVSRGDRVLILLPGERPGSVGDLLRKGLQRLGVTSVPHGPVRDPHTALEWMEKEKTDTLVGIPVQVLSLARSSDGKFAPRNVLLSTDHAPRAVSRALEQTWGCEVFTHYGMTEMGFGGGVECWAHSGYHLREADLYVEIVDPETGEPLPDGVEGEAVFTTLTRKGMPLIRYRTGDLSRFVPRPCPCRSVLKTMERVTKRISGCIPLAEGGKLTMADLDEALFGIEGILDFTATLSSAGHKERLEMEAVMNGHGIESAADRVKESIERIPPIASMLRSGKLDVIVHFIPPLFPIAARPAKRRIIDTRT